MTEPAEGVHVGDILVGTFVILFGLCITLVGGACTILWGASLSGMATYGFDLSQLALLLISLGTLALGLLCVVTGVRMARGKYRRKPGNEHGGAGDGTGQA